MKEQLKKKNSDTEMLIVHKPPQTEKNERKKGGELNKRILVKDVDILANQLDKTEGRERSDLVMEIQEQLGNDFATRVVEELEQRKNINMKTKTKKPTNT